MIGAVPHRVDLTDAVAERLQSNQIVVPRTLREVCNAWVRWEGEYLIMRDGWEKGWEIRCETGKVSCER